MPKFAPDRFPPGFFDLAAGAGEALPLDIIERWRSGKQTREAALALLEQHTLHGVVVSSDAAGLTRLARELPLVRILAMINRPKELIHAWGKAIGGRALGTWAADNTQMFYGEGCEPRRVVAMLRGVQRVLAAGSDVGIGLCAHRGTFYELGDGLYGPHADRVEIVAEEHTAPGELLVTDDLVAALGTGHGFEMARRGDLEADFGAIFSVTGGPELSDVEATDYHYPAPFSEDFHRELQQYGSAAAGLPSPKYADLAVVLVERERDEPDEPEIALLNDLALSAAMKRIADELLPAHGGTDIKTSGLIGIYTFPECAAAAAFAQDFRRIFAEQGVQTRAGIDVGEVLVFDLGRGRRDIAGSPVNVASKLAQDLGDFGRIYLSDAATQRARLERRSQTVQFDVAGAPMNARQL